MFKTEDDTNAQLDIFILPIFIYIVLNMLIIIESCIRYEPILKRTLENIFFNYMLNIFN